MSPTDDTTYLLTDTHWRCAAFPLSLVGGGKGTECWMYGRDEGQTDWMVGWGRRGYNILAWHDTYSSSCLMERRWAGVV